MTHEKSYHLYFPLTSRESKTNVQITVDLPNRDSKMRVNAQTIFRHFVTRQRNRWIFTNYLLPQLIQFDLYGVPNCTPIG